MIDLTRLEGLHRRGDKWIARCPACAEMGGDRSGEHLLVYENGYPACVVNPGPEGKEHRRRIRELVGADRMAPPKRAFLRPMERPRVEAKGLARLPSLRVPNVSEMAGIAHVRGWPLFAGLEMLSRRGLLWIGNVWDAGCEWPAWIVTDETRRNAQARRMDGLPWQGIGHAKAKSLPGSLAAWPIGATHIGERPLVILCEGQPDFCAALLVAWWYELSIESVAPVCMTGVGCSIHPDAMHYFAGKHVRIAIHDDDAGRNAAKNWADQLLKAGAVKVDGFNFAGLRRSDGLPVGDLADFATLLDVETPPTANPMIGLDAATTTPPRPSHFADRPGVGTPNLGAVTDDDETPQVAHANF